MTWDTPRRRLAPDDPGTVPSTAASQERYLMQLG